MSKKKELSPKDAAAAHLERLGNALGKRCKFSSRTVHDFAGTGKIQDVYHGGRGAWVVVLTGNKTVTVRPAQVKLY